MAKTFSIISLGCPRNTVDSEKLISEFTAKGYIFKKESQSSDLLVINTCAFIEDAKKESIDAILKVIDAKKNGDIKNIIVAGCLPQRYRDELAKEFKEVDEFRGVMDFTPHPSLSPKGERVRVRGVRLTPKHYAYIKISEGCSHRCSYCAIPGIKGNYKSRDIESIKKEANNFVKRGVKEIILIGQDISLYGMDLYDVGAVSDRPLLANLLKKLAAISKDSWIRLLYLHPGNLDREIVRAMKNNKSICKYVDLPLEHINDRILKQMGRKTTKKDITRLIEYIRKEIPWVAIRTSFIVGFPGETEKEFKELLSFIKDMKFERLGVFKYSREEGTPAYGYKNQIPEREKQKRFDKVMFLQQEVSREINEKFKGKVLKVLIEQKGRDYYEGRTEYDAPEIDGMVYVKGKDLRIGNFYDVKITDTYEYDLAGKTHPAALSAVRRITQLDRG